MFTKILYDRKAERFGANSHKTGKRSPDMEKNNIPTFAIDHKDPLMSLPGKLGQQVIIAFGKLSPLAGLQSLLPQMLLLLFQFAENLQPILQLISIRLVSSHITQNILQIS